MSGAVDNVRDIGTVPISAPPPKGRIHEAIAAIMKDVGGVGKNGRNEQQGYKFRGIADIYLACQPVMAKHQVHMAPHAVLDEKIWERQTKGGSLQMHIRQRIEFRFYHQDGSYVSCVTTGEAMDTSDKASNKVMSAAVKYALIVTFSIPEQDPEDADNDSPEASVGAAEKPASKSASKPTPAKATPAGKVDMVMELTTLMIGTKPKGLGWAKPHAVGWLKKRFSVEAPGDLDSRQAADAKDLLTTRLESEDKYRTKLEMFANEGRVLGDGEVKE